MLQVGKVMWKFWHFPQFRNLTEVLEPKRTNPIWWFWIPIFNPVVVGFSNWLFFFGYGGSTPTWWLKSTSTPEIIIHFHNSQLRLLSQCLCLRPSVRLPTSTLAARTRADHPASSKHGGCSIAMFDDTRGSSNPIRVNKALDDIFCCWIYTIVFGFPYPDVWVVRPKAFLCIFQISFETSKWDGRTNSSTAIPSPMVQLWFNYGSRILCPWLEQREMKCEPLKFPIIMSSCRYLLLVGYKAVVR